MDLGLGVANFIIHGIVSSLSLWILYLFEKNSSILCLGPQRCLGTCLDTTMAASRAWLSVEAIEARALNMRCPHRKDHLSWFS